MKVCFVLSCMTAADRGTGGIANLVHPLSNYLVQKEGINVLCYSLFGDEHPEQRFYNFRVVQNIIKHRSDAHLIFRLFFWMFSIFAFSWLMLSNRKELKDSLFVSTSPGISWFLSLIGLKIIVWENVSFFVKRPFLDDLRLKRFITCGSKIVVPTRSERRELIEKYVQKFGILDDQIIYIPDWIERSKRTITKTIPYSDEDRVRFCAAGQLDKRKGFDLLINALSLLNQSERSKIKIDIYGIGSQFLSLQKQINSSDLSDSITLMGYSEDLELVFSQYDGFILSSRYEGFPLVLGLALSCGLPAIATNCRTGPAEMIVDGTNGYLVDPNSSSSLKNGIQKYIKNIEYFRGTAKEKASNSMLSYSPSVIMQTWAKFLKNEYDRKIQ